MFIEKLLHYLVLLILIVLATPAEGQNTDPCGCDKALPDGLRDEFQSIYNANFKQCDSLLFSKSFKYWESGEWQNDISFESGGAYGIISGFLNGSESEGQKQQKFDSLKEEYNSHKDLEISSYKYLSQKTASQTAYTAWTKCKLGCQNQDEIVLEKLTQIAGQVTINLIPKTKHKFDAIKITHIEHPNVTILSGQLKEGKKIKWGQPYSGTFKLINPSQDGIIKINLENNYETETVVLTGSGQMLIKKAAAPETEVQITNGVLNTQSRMWAAYGTINPDPVGQWLDVPVRDSSRQFQAVWLKTVASANAINSTNYYSWNLEIVNHFGAKGPDGIGEGGRVDIHPEYSTIVKLPALQNYSDLSYSITLKCKMFEDFDNLNPYKPERGIVKISGRDLDTSFTVSLDSTSPAILAINNVKPGQYQLEMIASPYGCNARTIPNVAPGFIQVNYTINLAAGITIHGVPIPPPSPKPVPPKKSYLIFYLIGAALIAFIIFFIFLRKNKQN